MGANPDRFERMQHALETIMNAHKFNSAHMLPCLVHRACFEALQEQPPEAEADETPQAIDRAFLPMLQLTPAQVEELRASFAKATPGNLVAVPREPSDDELQRVNAELKRARKLLVQLYDAHPATRTMIEERTGPWFVWGVDLDAEPGDTLTPPAEEKPIKTIQSALQVRVQPWLIECFGASIAGDREERNHRFLEEALELVQACGCTASEAYQLVEYVFGRPKGEKAQEVGGVMITLAALCLANGLDMHQAGEVELERIWTMVDKIRAKQAAKPKHSPLPLHTNDCSIHYHANAKCDCTPTGKE